MDFYLTYMPGSPPSLPTLFNLFLLHVHIISTLLPSPSLHCLPHHIFWSLHSIMSLTSSPSSLLITCPYHLNLASLTFSAMSTTPHLLLISSFHNVSDQLSFISSYYVSTPSQPCFPHLLCNALILSAFIRRQLMSTLQIIFFSWSSPFPIIYCLLHFSTCPM